MSAPSSEKPSDVKAVIKSVDSELRTCAKCLGSGPVAILTACCCSRSRRTLERTNCTKLAQWTAGQTCGTGERVAACNSPLFILLPEGHQFYDRGDVADTSV